MYSILPIDATYFFHVPKFQVNSILLIFILISHGFGNPKPVSLPILDGYRKGIM